MPYRMNNPDLQRERDMRSQEMRSQQMRSSERMRAHPRDVDLADEGYRYPGGLRGGERPSEVYVRDRHNRFDDEREWDEQDPDELWRHGEYESRLYGNEVGAPPVPLRSHAHRADHRRHDEPVRDRRGPKGYARSDARVFEDVCERLASDDTVDVSEVSVHVNDGRVMLEGEVPERYMKHRVEDIVDACWGVKDVENRIRVGHDRGMQ